MNAEQTIKEMSLRVIVLSIFLTMILAMSNAYLALKIGILTSASIPAAVISMGILRLFKNPTIYENNLVQTAASAGEAIAGGIVYTIPALIIIRYWNHFDYWENLCIALIGGILGVLFSIPIRRVLVHENTLHFPEGRAIAEVLKISQEHPVGLKPLAWGSLVGAIIELAQSGLKIIANSWQTWTAMGKTFVGFGTGFSVTLIGAGYVIGFNVALSIFIGAIVGWLFGVPITALIYPVSAAESNDVTQAVMNLWWQKMSYLGISAMLFAGLYTLGALFKPFYRSFKHSLMQLNVGRNVTVLPRTEKDIPLPVVLLGIILLLIFTFYFFQMKFPFQNLPMVSQWNASFILGCLIYLLISGFIISAIASYFSGLVGVSASPGSALLIAGLLIAALGMRSVIDDSSDTVVMIAAQAIVIMMGAIVTGAAAIANDNIQDLKVGQLIGATPWKQQIMLLLGVFISALVIPPVMELLFNTYGIADVFPHANMDPTQTLPAPPAALMAATTRAVFQHELPWSMVVSGIIVIACVILINRYLNRFNKRISVLGVAIGIYLPLTSSTPIFVGGLIAYYIKKKLKRQNHYQALQYKGTVLACGLIAGSVLMDVILAIPFSLTRNPDVLRIIPTTWIRLPLLGGALIIVGLMYWFNRVVCHHPK